jgi:hypothetical protein
MASEEMIKILLGVAPLFLKIFLLMLLLLHIAFSLVLVRQTKLMIKVVEAEISPTIYFISVIHLLFSTFVLLWVIIFL